MSGAESWRFFRSHHWMTHGISTIELIRPPHSSGYIEFAFRAYLTISFPFWKLSSGSRGHKIWWWENVGNWLYNLCIYIPPCDHFVSCHACWWHDGRCGTVVHGPSWKMPAFVVALRWTTLVSGRRTYGISKTAITHQIEVNRPAWIENCRATNWRTSMRMCFWTVEIQEQCLTVCKSFVLDFYNPAAEKASITEQHLIAFGTVSALEAQE